MSVSTIILEGRWRRTARGPASRRRGRTAPRLWLEPLEVRSLLSGSTPAGAIATLMPNETVLGAWDLGALDTPTTVLGSVGEGPNGAADVTWYQFHLAQASRVDFSMTAPAGAQPFAGVVSLYNSDLGDWGDPYNMTGYRLMAQVTTDPRTGIASCIEDLGPGDYDVAVSGAGNTAFSPVLAGSGFPGAMGVYELSASSTDLGLSGGGPTVLWSDPAAGAAISSSPLAIRVGLSAPVDLGTVLAGQTVQLLSVAPDGTRTQVPLSWTNVSTAGDELQLFPQAPLAPGNYVVQLSGDATGDGQTILGLNERPLGSDTRHPQGVDESFTFRVDGVDGVAGATASDSTPTTAHQIGDITSAGQVQIPGAIGVDPKLSPAASADPCFPDPAHNPANQADLYHFTISGPGHYALLAEAFAGRIGSPLDPGLSLFKLDPATGTLVFLVGDDNTMDSAAGADGSVPLLLDPALTAGLTAGDYYIAVAGGSNTPSPLEYQAPGSPGIYDPNRPGSAQNGWSTGPYLLNLVVRPETAPLRVVATTPSAGQVLTQAPTEIAVQFSQPVSIQLLESQSCAAPAPTWDPYFFIEGADGTIYVPRYVRYDGASNTATFEMLDGLAPGSYALHLSGRDGLANLAGDPLAGNDPSGDLVVPFSVGGSARALAGSTNGGFWVIAQPGVEAEDLGLLYPNELKAGVAILRYPSPMSSPGANTAQDAYTFRVLEDQRYLFQVLGGDLPPGIRMTLTDSSGQSIGLGPPIDNRFGGATLQPGTYTISVSGWAPGAGAGLSYQLLLTVNAQYNNAPPLSDSPAPAIQVTLAGFPGTPGDAPGAGSSTSVGTEIVGPVAGGSVGADAAGNGGGTSSPGPAADTLGSGAPASSASIVASSAASGPTFGLSGLAMGPLGGWDGQFGPAPSAMTQVTLAVPSGPSMTPNSIAVSLVTLTQALPWDSEGQSVLADPPAAATEDPPATPREGEKVESDQPGPPDIPRPSTDEPVLAVPTVGQPPESPEHTAAPWPAGRPAVPGPADRPPMLTAVEPPAADGREPSRGPSSSLATRWVMAGAVMVAIASRARPVIRALDWRKRAGGTAARPFAARRPTLSDAELTVAHLPVRSDSAHSAIRRIRGGVRPGSPSPVS